MSLVDLTKIPQWQLDFTKEVIPLLEAIDTNNNHSGYVYDSLWGYFTFGQSVQFVYERNDNKYSTTERFNIHGIFTINAEEGKIINSTPSNDAINFDKIKSKYEQLENYFNQTQNKLPPNSLDLYFTNQDERCIMLPEILKDKEGKNVYARPLNLQIEQTTWPSHIIYTAELLGESTELCKLVINDTILDDGVLDITFRKPRIKMVNYTFASNSDIFFHGWENRKINISGTLNISHNEGQFASPELKDFLNQLATGKVDIKKVVKGSNTKYTIYEDLFISQQDLLLTKRRDSTGYRVNIAAKE